MSGQGGASPLPRRGTELLITGRVGSPEFQLAITMGGIRRILSTIEPIVVHRTIGLVQLLEVLGLCIENQTRVHER